jgi:hypothetical protein
MISYGLLLAIKTNSSIFHRTEHSIYRHRRGGRANRSANRRRFLVRDRLRLGRFRHLCLRRFRYFHLLPYEYLSLIVVCCLTMTNSTRN